MNINKLFYQLFKADNGENGRVNIMKALLEAPMNLNQLAKKLDVNYRTVKHHVDILVKEEMLSVEKRRGRYGSLYFPSNLFKSHIKLFYDIIGGEKAHLVDNANPFCEYQYLCNEFNPEWSGKCLIDSDGERPGCKAYRSITQSLARLAREISGGS